MTVSGGLSWSGGYQIGDRIAELRTNATGSTPPPFTLFRAESEVEGAAGLDARVGVAITPSMTVEVGFTASKPRLRTTFSDDAEAAATSIDAEELSQIVVEVGGVWQLPIAPLGRLRPFATGGGGYLRQLYEERTLVETGSIWYLGGGARYFLRGGDGMSRALGVRGDLRATWRNDGVEFEGKTRVGPTAAVSMFFEF